MSRLIELNQQLLEGFPDFKFTMEDIIGEGDKVTVRWLATGTHSGRIFDSAPTYKVASTTGMTLFKIVGSKIAEQWIIRDDLGTLHQVGVVFHERG